MAGRSKQWQGAIESGQAIWGVTGRGKAILELKCKFGSGRPWRGMAGWIGKSTGGSGSGRAN